MNLLEHLKDKAVRMVDGGTRFDGYGVARFRRSVANADGFAFGPGDHGLVKLDGGEDAMAFSFRTGKFSMVRTGSYEILPSDAPLPVDGFSAYVATSTPVSEIVDELPEDDPSPGP